MQQLDQQNIMKKTFIVVLAVIAAGVVSAGVLEVRPWESRLPVSVSFRNAHFDNSLVAQIHNDSDSVRKVLVLIQSPTTGETERMVELIPGRDMVEIGWLQGWRFVSGERLQIHQSGYRDEVETIP
jgi:hypothetical protein